MGKGVSVLLKNGGVGGSRVGILGAGIMGSCLALALARKGFQVTVFDAKKEPMTGASRWNEGKIHLGYLYGADPSLETARKVVAGGIHFADSLSRLLESSVEAAFTTEDDIYLVHKASVVSAEELDRYSKAVHSLVRSHSDAEMARRLFGGNGPRRLLDAELDGIADRKLVEAGFHIPERSVETNWIADMLCLALSNNPNIELRMNTRVLSAKPETSVDGRWRVHCTDGEADSFDIVANALWNGRLAIDRTAGMEPTGTWSNRYRVALFARTSEPLNIPSAIVAVGPFGDIKNYNGRDFYLSWYPVGLMSDSSEIDPSEPPDLEPKEQADIANRMVAGLAEIMPRVGEILDHATEFKVKGGFVFARGGGSLADRKASIHRRDGFGIERLGRYISIDTGKYSTAPLMAEQLAAEISAL